MRTTTEGTDPFQPHPSDPAEYKDLGQYFDSLAAEAKTYFATEKEGLTLFVYEKLGKAVGGLIGLVISAISILFFVIFASVALSLYIGTLIESTALGFLIVGGLYLLIFIIVHFIARQAIRDSTMLNVINSFYDEND